MSEQPPLPSPEELVSAASTAQARVVERRTGGVFERRTGTVCLLAGVAVVAARLLLLPLLPVPIPSVHDEFSYLLGADTFASGRLTNPPHPMWTHFESFHVNYQPTYHSKYPPAQAVFLATGQKLVGSPWAGVLLGVACMFAATLWMLVGWLPPRYAAAAAFLAAAEWGLTSYWANSYWGGAVAAIGGALVIGSVPRLARGVAPRTVLLAATGVVLLANCRPYEGAATVAASAAVLMWLRRRERAPLAGLAGRGVVLPFLAVTIPAVAAMGYYNFRTTGSPTLLPYVVNQRTYAASPHIYLLPRLRQTPVYRHEVQRRLWLEWDRSFYEAARRDPFAGWKFASGFVVPFFAANLLGLMALAGCLAGRGGVKWPALAILLVPLAAVTLEKAFLPHYLAPMCGAYLVLAGLGLERLGRWKKGVGVLVVLALAAGGLAGEVAGQAREARLAAGRGLYARPALAEMLRRQGGRHLVLVRYSATHQPHGDWVANAADIDGASVVWARDMGEGTNAELLDYYRDRRVWLLEPDRSLTPQPYPRPLVQSTAH